MKKLRYILAILFSSLIIISGVGVSVMHYCCAGCETTRSCCSTGCSRCDKSHHSPQKSCKDTGCTAVHYKVDIVNHAQQVSSMVVPVFTLFCELLPHFTRSLSVGTDKTEVLSDAPPVSIGSRHYLALYSILLI